MNNDKKKINKNVVLTKPFFDFTALRCKGKAKRAQADPERYPLENRYVFLLKQIKRMLKILKVKIIVKGYENVQSSGPAFLVSNHQDNSDPIIIACALAKQGHDKEEKEKLVTFLAKEELKYNPKTRWPLELINTFFLDRDNPRAAYETYLNFGKFVKNEKTFGLIFPEGTRNTEGSISPFKSAAVKVAQKELISIIPVTINNSISGFTHKRNVPLVVEVIFHKKISASSFVNQTSQALAQRIENIVKSEFKKPEYNFEYSLTEKKKQKLLKLETKFKKTEQKIFLKDQKRRQKEADQEKKVLEQEEKELKKYMQKEEKKEKEKK
ncbi:MAG: lysophospholipid acyltransferase family protein [Metamycoplasmataceae bacterium]